MNSQTMGGQTKGGQTKGGRSKSGRSKGGRVWGSRTVRGALVAVLVAVGVVALPATSAQAVSVPPTLVGLDAASGRLAIFSSSSGRLVKFLTPKPGKYDEGLPTYSWDHSKILFIRDGRFYRNAQVWGTFSMPANGGTITQIGKPPYGYIQPIAAGPGGAFAGNTGQIASHSIVARNAAGRKVILGYTYFGMDSDGMAWSPDGVTLAVSTVPHYPLGAPMLAAQVHLTNTRTVAEVAHIGAAVACPATLRGCGLHAPGYGRDGSLYMVATKGKLAYLVRLAKGAKVPRIVVKLPAQALVYRVFVATTGAVLVQAETWIGAPTRSTFTSIWNGKTLRQLPKTILEPAW